MTRYYLTQLPDNTWQVTLQDNTSGEWVETEVVGTYDNWQDALALPIAPICFDPKPEWPKELGGQS